MSLYECFFSVSMYKPKQGLLIRRVFQMFSSLCGVGLGVSMARVSPEAGGLVAVGVFVALLLWLSWRVLQYPPVCDFLIDVQVESGRVAWSRAVDVKRSTFAVLFVMFLVSFYLFVCDRLLQYLLKSAFVLNF